jgi:sugar O-acyltransferase (sialic acid O-acetyltransferase NeuD family)
MGKPVIIFCATDFGKAVLEIFRSNDVVAYGFLDDNKALWGTEIEDITVLGSTEDESYLKIIGKDCDVFVASDDDAWRANVIKNLRSERKAMPVNAIHKTAYIAPSAMLHHGCLINQNVQIGAGCKIGNHCILHAGSIVDFATTIGDFVQVGAGSIISSGAQIGSNVFIGSGVTIVSGVTIGEGARIGAGSVVVSDVKKGETVFGNPATAIKRP